tara:strand:+ start:1763 stop:1939 length:177 start_codon:yes stop_codon:yes gene_type:complete
MKSRGTRSYKPLGGELRHCSVNGKWGSGEKSFEEKLIREREREDFLKIPAWIVFVLEV